MTGRISRRALQWLRAVKRNPGLPSFEGLDIQIEHMDASSGLLSAPAFEKHVMEQQRVEAFIMKQSRLMREEEAADRKKTNPGGGPSDPKGRNRNGKGGDQPGCSPC